jgi:hypothetical protein
MKQSCAILLLVFCGVLAAEEKKETKATPQPEVELAPGNVAFFRYVNAIGLTTPTKVSFRTGAEPKYFEIGPGETSAMRTLRLGEYKLRVANEGCEKPEVEDIISLTTGGTYTLVVLYTDTVEKEGKTIHRLQYSKLQRSGEAKGPRLSIVSLVDVESLPIQMGDRSLALLPRRAQHFDMKRDEIVAISFGGSPVIEPVEIVDDIPYLVFLFKNEATGKIEGTLSREITVVLELPRSMQHKNAAEEAEKPKAEPKP